MHAERQEQLAAVVQVVLENPPDDPLARIAVGLLALLLDEDIGQTSWRPAVEALAHHLPGRLQSLDQLGGGARWRAVRIPGFEGGEGGISLPMES